METNKKKTVLATGAFDILHYGHLRFFEEAKKAGGEDSRLLVIVASDKTVQKRKQTGPVMSEGERRALVAALKPVDEAFIGSDEIQMEETIEKVRPDIVVVGYDQTDIENTLKKLQKDKGYSFKILRLEHFGSEDIDSSSKIKYRVLENWRKKS